MFDISENKLTQLPDNQEFKSYQAVTDPLPKQQFGRWLMAFFGIGLALLFCPWTQNIQTTGLVTALRPEQRPQTIHSTISGRIEKWHVAEGQRVRRGDTIAQLSEVKTEYFDPQLVGRVGSQVDAKAGSLATYGQKLAALDEQIRAILLEKDNKMRQLENKIEQNRLKTEADKRDIEAAKIASENAEKQAARMAELFEKGLNSLTQLENARAKSQENAAKLISAQNKYDASLQELATSELALRNNQNEFQSKLAKAESDRQAALSDRFDAEASLQKLQVDRANYSARAAFYFITAPQDCYITKAIKPGIGEIVKEGEPLVSIMPSAYELAVEMFVKPVDLPLISVGNNVRFVFDGWPALVFSGWPGLNFGTFQGRVAAVDNNISENGKFRVLVAPDHDTPVWPTALRPGGGARCIAMLHDVPLYFEIWRKINGFPPEFYKNEKAEKEDLKKQGAK